MAHDVLLAPGTDARHLVEDRDRLRLGAQLAVEGDRETVRLVADLLDQVERGRAGGQHDRRLVPGHEDLLVRLGQAADGDVEPELLELGHRSRELRLAAVDHEQVGARPEALVGHALRGVAAAEHLLHAHEVVGLIKLGADFEAAVLALVGPAVGEDDHGRHREGAVQGGDVETLDPHRRRIEGQGALELEQGLVGAVVGVARADHVAVEGMAGVAGGHLEQADLVAPARDVQAADVAALVGQPLPHHVGVGQNRGQVDLGRDVGGLVVVALEEALGQLHLVHIHALVQDELGAADHAPLAHDEDAGRADRLLAGEADGVHRDVVAEEDFLFGVGRLKRLQAPLEPARPLEIEVGRSLPHLVGQVVHHVAPFTRQEALDLVDVARILHGVDRAGADARPAAHVVVEAGPSQLGQGQRRDAHLVGMGREVAAAPLPFRAGRDADRRHLAQGVDRGARGLGIGVGAEVARALLVVLACVFDRGEDVRLRDRDVGIALVVLEVDVEIGMVLVDELALQDQRLVLGPHDDVVEGPHHLHHQGDLGSIVRERRVLAHAGAEVLGLAHIDDCARRIAPEVAARVGGHALHLLGDAGQPLVLGPGRREAVSVQL